MTTAKNAAYVRNWSDERCRRYNARPSGARARGSRRSASSRGTGAPAVRGSATRARWRGACGEPPRRRRGNRAAGGPAGAGGPSEDLLHHEAPRGLEPVEIGEQALERRAALEERLELQERVPGRQA